jgi:hypothetical protein
MTMIERAAQAIAERNECDRACAYDPDSCQCRLDAIAAISALLEPTMSMQSAGELAINGHGGGPWSASRACWQAMVEAALPADLHHKLHIEH